MIKVIEEIENSSLDDESRRFGDTYYPSEVGCVDAYRFEVLLFLLLLVLRVVPVFFQRPLI